MKQSSHFRNRLNDLFAQQDPACDLEGTTATASAWEKTLILAGWEQAIPEVLGQMRTVAAERAERAQLLAEVRSLARRVSQLEGGTLSVMLTTLASENLTLTKSVPVVICNNDGDFIASFFDANIHASGETEQEAFDGLREILIATFRILDEHDQASLGPEPLRQLSVLRSFIRRA